MNKTLTLFQIPAAILWCCCQVFLLDAQPKVKTEHLALRDGLPHRWTLDALQDRNGFLWIATYDGLCRYDGHQFVVYRHDENDPHSLSSNRVIKLSEDNAGYLWVNTETGVDRFDPAFNRFSHFTAWQQEGAVQCLTTGDDKRSWRILQRNTKKETLEIQALNGTTLQGPAILLDGAEKLSWLRQIDSTTLLAYTIKGYWLIDLATEKAQHLGLDGNPKHLPENIRVPADASGRIWYFNEKTRALQAVSGPLVDGKPSFSLFTDEGLGEKWLVCIGGDLWRLHETSGTFERIGQAGDGRIFTDQDGIIWSCSQQGIYKIRQSYPMFQHRLSLPFAIGETPPIGYSARAMAELQGGRIFVAKDREVLEARPGRAFKYGESDISMDVWQILTGRDGKLWFTSDHTFHPGLSCFDPANRQTQTFYLPDERSFHVAPWLFQDHDGRFWMFFRDRAWWYDPVTNKFTRSKTDLHLVACASYDTTDNTISGVYNDNVFRLDCARDTLTEVFKLAATTQAPVAKGIVRHAGRIWIATTSGLFAIRESDKQREIFTRKNGLPHDIVYSVVPDGKFLWLGTHEGLCRFNIETGETRNFFVEDGLSHNEFNSRSTLQAADGHIWMGGLNGINIFDPRQFDGSRDQRRPRLHWSRCTWFDQKRDTIAEIPFHHLNNLSPVTVAPGDANYTFYFALDNYAEPSMHTFSWYFEGLDKTWGGWSNYALVSFQTLPPGTHLLHVRGRDERGNPAANELVIPIRVVKVWYLRWWAIVLYVLLGGAVVYTVFRVQLSRRLAHAENERLRALDELKNSLYTNITHEFRTPLTLLLGPAERVLNRWHNHYPADLKNAMLTVRQNGYRLLNLVNQILDLRKMDEGLLAVHWVQGDIMLLLRYMADSFHSLAEQKKIRFHFHNEPTSLWMDYDKDKLLKMVSNLLSNAFKFTPDGGEITFSAQISGDVLQIQVQDNGPGIAPEHLQRIFERFYQAPQKAAGAGTGIGLALTKELAELLGGSIKVRSEIQGGSGFTILLPIHRVATERDTNQDTDHLTPYTGLGTAAEMPASDESAVSAEAPLALVVDDNPEIARYVGQCLSAKYRVEYAPNGRIGIEKAIELIPDLIVSDLMMPEKDGFELTQTLKNDVRSSHIPIILLTARAEVAARLEGLRRGADAYLSKPFNEEELLILAEQQLLLRRRLQQRYAGLQSDKDTPQPETLEAEGLDTVLEDAFFKKVMEAANTRLEDADFGGEELARAVFISHSQLNRKLNALTGKSSVQILRDLRLRRAQSLLRNADMTVSEVAWESGFNDPAYFTRIFTREFGLSPSLWREKNH